MRDTTAGSGFHRHDHLHRLKLNVGLALLHNTAAVLQVPDNLTVELRAQLGGIEDCRNHDRRDPLETEPKAKRLFGPEHLHYGCAHCDENGAVGLRTYLGHDRLVTDTHREEVGTAARDVELKLDTLKSNLDWQLVRGTDPLDWPNLTLAQGLQHLFLLGLQCVHRPDDGGIEDDVVIVVLHPQRLFPEDTIEPRRVNRIVPECVCASQLDEILHRVPDFAHDVHVLQCEHE
mmetsp:Transcript_49636/g.138942  ORF Transcript_49636/g.138942 Transcript_49636/m.138942 type:complete len:232 (+) Transcript_49636:4062-4757(+)